MSLRLFARVKSEDEKNQISFHLMKEKAALDIELTADKHNLRVHGVAKEGFVLAAMDGNSNGLNLNEGNCTVRIIYKQQEYFFESAVNKDGQQYLLKFPEEIFRLQQRQSFRHQIRELFSSRICILALDERPMDLHFDLIDLNNDGCQMRLAVPLPGLKSGSHLRGNLELPNRKIVPFQATIRHISQKDHSTYLGLEFTAVNDQFQEQIQTFLFEVHLHLFNQRTA